MLSIIVERRGTWLRRLKLLLLVQGFLLLLTSGCGSIDSLDLTNEQDAVLDHSQPYSVALGEVEDDIKCDDEGYFLQRFINDKGIFYNCTLADPDLPLKYNNNANIVISGKMSSSSVQTKKDHPSIWVGLGTFGFYYILGFNYKYDEMTVQYDFKVNYLDKKMSKTYQFEDVRTYHYGAYGPNYNLKLKPRLYYPGWEFLIYRVCSELDSLQRGNKED